jgi:hypothetical protein
MINKDIENIVALTFGHCPICRILVSYFDFMYVHNQQHVIDHHHHYSNKWWNKLPEYELFCHFDEYKYNHFNYDADESDPDNLPDAEIFYSYNN